MTETEEMMTMKESNKKVLTKRDITLLGFRSSFLQASFNYERMQAGGWTCSMLPTIEKIHKGDKQAISDSMKDNLEFINTHPNLVGFLMGLLLSLEESGEDRNLIKGLKVALFGPLAGIGDAIFWFTILPIVAGISASFAEEGSVLGPIIFFTVYFVIFLFRVVWTHFGYNLGIRAIEKIKENSEIVSKAATILGTTVIGGLIASYVHIEVVSQIVVNAEKTVSLQADLFDKIFPNILPFAYTMLMYAILRTRKVSPTLLILLTFIASIILSALKIL